jgi:hypothetical protein
MTEIRPSVRAFRLILGALLLGALAGIGSAGERIDVDGT